MEIKTQKDYQKIMQKLCSKTRALVNAKENLQEAINNEPNKMHVGRLYALQDYIRAEILEVDKQEKRIQSSVDSKSLDIFAYYINGGEIKEVKPYRFYTKPHLNCVIAVRDGDEDPHVMARFEKIEPEDVLDTLLDKGLDWPNKLINKEIGIYPALKDSDDCKKVTFATKKEIEDGKVVLLNLPIRKENIQVM